MVTTKRLSRDYKGRESRGVEEGVDTLSFLKELSTFWFLFGSDLIHVTNTRLFLRIWFLGEDHLIRFDGEEEEIRPLIKSAFAFAKANEISEIPGFLSKSEKFYEFLGMAEIVEITDAAWRNKPLLMSSIGMAKFAFLIGAGIKPSDPSLGKAISGLGMDDLFAFAQLSRISRRPLEKLLKIID